MSVEPGLNMELIRCEDKPFDEGVRRAAEIGYRFLEPLVHYGGELLSEGGDYHSFSMDNDPFEMKDIPDRYGVKASGLSAHSPLMRRLGKKTAANEEEGYYSAVACFMANQAYRTKSQVVWDKKWDLPA